MAWDDGNNIDLVDVSGGTGFPCVVGCWLRFTMHGGERVGRGGVMYEARVSPSCHANTFKNTLKFVWLVGCNIDGDGVSLALSKTRERTRVGSESDSVG